MKLSKEFEMISTLLTKIGAFFKKCYIANTGYCMFIEDNPLDKLNGKYLCIINKKYMDVFLPYMNGNPVVYIDSIDAMKKTIAESQLAADAKERLGFDISTDITLSETEADKMIFNESVKLPKSMKDFLAKKIKDNSLYIKGFDSNYIRDFLYKKRYIQSMNEKMCKWVYDEIDELTELHNVNEPKQFITEDIYNTFMNNESYTLHAYDSNDEYIDVVIGKSLFPLMVKGNYSDIEYFVHKRTEELWLFCIEYETEAISIQSTYGVLNIK